MDNKATPVDYYHDLGLERNASQRDIKVAYMKLARQHHPDKKLHSTDTAEFRKVSCCFKSRSCLHTSISTFPLTDFLF